MKHAPFYLALRLLFALPLAVLAADPPAPTSSDTKTSDSSATAPSENVMLTNAPPMPEELKTSSNLPIAPAAETNAPVVPVTNAASAPANPDMVKSGLGAETDKNVKLQIFLDQQNFGPGYIDGHTGQFTKEALVRFKQARNLPAEGDLDPALMEGVTEIYTTYTISEEDTKHIGTVPDKPAEKAKQDKLQYTNLAELVSEKYHTDPKFLRELNKGVNLDALAPGQALKVPNVQPFQLADLKKAKEEKQAEGKKKKKEIAAASAGQRITIDRKKRVLELRENDQLTASFPVTVGEGEVETPVGEWKVKSIDFNPTFRWDEGMLNKGKRTSQYYMLPPGPNNPVGVVWIGLDKDGIGIHGTSDPKGIGRNVSHGCVRLSNWDVLKLVHMVHKGTPVSVVN